ncbi:MAG TPA: class I SAM-dependent methyltransferase, partial [Flavobacteriaceae bacterium]|nr:class I SAM-dependent methyltransferase [Flavobacteriaceae bacterium]
AVNQKSAIAFEHIHWYSNVVKYLKQDGNFKTRNLDGEKFHVLSEIMQHFKTNCYELSDKPETLEIQQQIIKHIEGVLVGPITVFMGMNGMFHKYFMEASFSADEFHEDAENFDKILDFFSQLGWFTKKNNTYSFTEKGFFYAKRASAYGVTVSYIPTLRHIDTLIFGDFSNLRTTSSKSPEIHVDRVMNVWGSGGAHSAYFKKIDEIIIDIFNKPLDKQPKGILDMGCGNGAFLIHLFDVIENHTLRGKHLEEHPLFLVGADYNKEALKVTRANLIKADIWAKVIWGDIGDPKQLDKDIYNDYAIHLSELLNVRTFLDHNRTWNEPQPENISTNSLSSGAFVFKGVRLANNKVEASLKEHLSKWKPFVKKYGLILIELHTIHPSLTAKNLGKTAATAYDATHGFSDQYILELDAFLKILDEIGLKSSAKHFSRFPDSDLATVSIHYVKE